VKSARIALFLVLVAALAIRLGWGLSRPSDAASIEQLPDQREYLELARNLIHQHELTFYDPRFKSMVVAYRTPGYPAFVALCGAKPPIARAAQAVVDTLTALAMYFLARRWLDEWFSVLAAAFVAFNPYLIYFSGLILSETLFIGMLAWAMVLLQRNGLLGGLLLALSILVRPSAIGLPIMLGAGAAVLNRESRGAYPKWWPLPPATTQLLLTVLVLFPWAYRNHLRLGRWIWTTTNGGMTAYDGFNPEATGASDQRLIAQNPVLLRAGEVQRDDYLSERAILWAKKNPRRVMELAVAKVARTWSPVPLSAEFGRPIYRLIGGLWAVPFDLLVIFGLFYGRLPRAAKMFLLLPAIYFTILHALSVGSLRYRLPAEPPMGILAVDGCSLLVASRSNYRRSETSPATSN
jgi:4-amino-4-deoxy-L-arabinose transferase-like glycosyltransferase